MCALSVSKFTQLVKNPTTEGFNEAIGMLDKAFVCKRNHGRYFIIPTESNSSTEYSYLRPFVKQLSDASKTLNKEPCALKKFQEILDLEPDCCDAVVYAIWDFIIGRSRTPSLKEL